MAVESGAGRHTTCDEGRLAKLLAADPERGQYAESIREGVREVDAADESLPGTELVAWEGNPPS
jgi:hypothetical protein